MCLFVYEVPSACVQIISFDIKPENVLLDPTMTVARLTDVGLAKVHVPVAMICIFCQTVQTSL